MDAPGFNPNLHPRDLVGRWAHVASGDQAAKKLAVATKPAVPAKKLPPGRVSNILVGGGVFDSSQIPAQPLSAKAQAAQIEGRKFENMDLAWPTRDELPRMQDRDAKVNFIKAQYHGILDHKNLDATKDNPATPEVIAARLGKPIDEVKTVLMHLEAQSVVYGTDAKGYYVNRALGSARTGRTSSYARHVSKPVSMEGKRVKVQLRGGAIRSGVVHTEYDTFYHVKVGDDLVNVPKAPNALDNQIVKPTRKR
jgi:hypothetical protein